MFEDLATSTAWLVVTIFYVVIFSIIVYGALSRRMPRKNA